MITLNWLPLYLYLTYKSHPCVLSSIFDLGGAIYMWRYPKEMCDGFFNKEWTCYHRHSVGITLLQQTDVWWSPCEWLGKYSWPRFFTVIRMIKWFDGGTRNLLDPVNITIFFILFSNVIKWFCVRWEVCQIYILPIGNVKCGESMKQYPISMHNIQPSD